MCRIHTPSVLETQRRNRASGLACVLGVLPEGRSKSDPVVVLPNSSRGLPPPTSREGPSACLPSVLCGTRLVLPRALITVKWAGRTPVPAALGEIQRVRLAQLIWWPLLQPCSPVFPNRGYGRPPHQSWARMHPSPLFFFFFVVRGAFSRGVG